MTAGRGVQGTAASIESRLPWRAIVAVSALVVVVAGGGLAWWSSRPVELDDEIDDDNAADVARLMEVQLDAELAVLRTR